MSMSTGLMHADEPSAGVHLGQIKIIRLPRSSPVVWLAGLLTAQVM